MGFFKRSPLWSYVEKSDTPFCSIRINQGPYKGLVYYYGRVQFSPPGTDGPIKMKFEYTVIESPKGFQETQEVVDFLGEILSQIIEEEYVKKDRV